MKKWRNIRKRNDKRIFNILSVLFGTLLLYRVMYTGMPATDFVFSAATVYAAVWGYRNNADNKAVIKQYIMLDKCIENIRAQLIEGKSSEPEYLTAEGMPNSVFCMTGDTHYIRLLKEIYQIYRDYGEGDGGFSDALDSISKELVLECSIRQKQLKELSGLSVIILSAIPMLPLIRQWVIYNLLELEMYYTDMAGVAIKYGLWAFALAVYVLLQRLGKMKWDVYMNFV